MKIEKNSPGQKVSHCPVLVLNATDKEICLRENRIIGTLEPYHQDVEGYISTVAESLNEIRKIGGNRRLLNSVVSDGNE